MKALPAQTHSSLSFSDLELVLALVRGRTLNGAAERLKLDASTVFRSIKRLERNLGEALFDRGRHGYAPTGRAQELALYAERIEAHLHAAREAALRPDSGPSGQLRITTTDTVLHSVLLPLLKRFADAWPNIGLELVAANALANLGHRDADVAIRATRTPPDHLVGVRLGTLQAAVFGGSDYLARQGAALPVERMDWIALDDSLPDHPSQAWRRAHYPQVNPRYRVNSVMSVAGAVACGLGVGVVPLAVFRGNDSVRIVQGPLPELATDLWCLAHPDARRLKRVKVLFEFLRAHVNLGSEHN